MKAMFNIFDAFNIVCSGDGLPEVVKANDELRAKFIGKLVPIMCQPFNGMKIDISSYQDYVGFSDETQRLLIEGKFNMTVVRDIVYHATFVEVTLIPIKGLDLFVDDDILFDKP